MLVIEIHATSRLTCLVSFELASMMMLLLGVTDGVVVRAGQGTLLALLPEHFRFLAWARLMFSGTIFKGSASAS